MSRTEDEGITDPSLSENRAYIASLILSALESEPFLKDLTKIMSEIRKNYPLDDINKAIKTHRDSGHLGWFGWDYSRIYNLMSRIDKEMKKARKSKQGDRFYPAFSYVLWLCLEILYRTDLQIISKGEDFEARANRAYEIVLAIHQLNSFFPELTGVKSARLFATDIPDLFVRLPTRCTNYNDFVVKINCLKLVFEVNCQNLRKTVKGNLDKNIGSIKIVKAWLDENSIPTRGIIDTWQNIAVLRNAKPTHANVVPEKVKRTLKFFDQKPQNINYTELWDSVLDKFEKSLHAFQEITLKT